jgi:hypothetical protein
MHEYLKEKKKKKHKTPSVFLTKMLSHLLINDARKQKGRRNASYKIS